MPETQYKIFITGLVLFISISSLQFLSNRLPINEGIKFVINADYLPPFLPFGLSTLGFGLMLIALFMFISKFVTANKFANNLAKTGQMTLTHYISHLTIGMIIFAMITGKRVRGKNE